MSGGKRHRATIGALDQGRLVHELMRRAFEPPHSAGISAKNASDLRKKTTSGVNGCPGSKPEIAHTVRCRLHARSFAFHRRSLTAASFSRRIRSNREIHLPLECIHADDENAHLIADPESFARSSPNELSASRFE